MNPPTPQARPQPAAAPSAAARRTGQTAADGPQRRRIPARLTPPPAQATAPEAIRQPSVSEMAVRSAAAKPPLQLKPAAARRACPAAPPVLIRTAGLLAVAAAVILALPPLSKGTSTTEAPLLGIVSPSGAVYHEPPASMARRQPPPQPVLHEGRLAAQSAPPATGSIGHFLTPRAVTVTPIATAGTGPKPQPKMAALSTSPVPPADNAKVAAVPMPRPAGLAAHASAASAQTNAASPLIEKARHLIAHGNLTEGRATLRQAIDAGSPHAATILAKTYDPAVLKSWHVKGAKVDPAEARHWYQKAEELGSPAAKAALNRLQ